MLGALGCDAAGGHRASGGIGLGDADADADPGGDEDADGDSDEADDESGGTDDGGGEPAGEDPQPDLPFDPGQLAEVCARSIHCRFDGGALFGLGYSEQEQSIG